MVTSGYNNVNATPQAGDGGGYLYVLNALTGADHLQDPDRRGRRGHPERPGADQQLRRQRARRQHDAARLRRRPAGQHLALRLQRRHAAGDAARHWRHRHRWWRHPQPITIRPELAELDGKPFVLVGTGELLGATDVSDPQTQIGLRHRRPADRHRPDLPEPAQVAGAADDDAGRQRRGGDPHDHLHGTDAQCSHDRRAGARPGRSRRARQRRDAAGARARWSSPATCRKISACIGRRPQLVQPDRLPHRLAVSSSPGAIGLASTSPTRSTSASTSCSCQPSPTAATIRPYVDYAPTQSGYNATGVPPAAPCRRGQADQLARDRGPVNEGARGNSAGAGHRHLSGTGAGPRRRLRRALGVGPCAVAGSPCGADCRPVVAHGRCGRGCARHPACS